MLTIITPERKLTREEHIKIFFQQAPVLDIAEFCKKNGYCVVIQSKDDYYMQKEKSNG